MVNLSCGSIFNVCYIYVICMFHGFEEKQNKKSGWLSSYVILRWVTNKYGSFELIQSIYVNSDFYCL